MKLVIKETTVNSINAMGAECIAQFGVTLPPEGVQEVTQYKNLSITRQGEDIVVEVNDEGLFMVMRMYLRVAKVIGAFIEPVKALFALLKEDMSEFESFVNEEKPLSQQELKAQYESWNQLSQAGCQTRE